MTALLCFAIGVPCMAFGALAPNGAEFWLGALAFGMGLGCAFVAAMRRDWRRNQTYANRPYDHDNERTA